MNENICKENFIHILYAEYNSVPSLRRDEIKIGLEKKGFLVTLIKDDFEWNNIKYETIDIAIIDGRTGEKPHPKSMQRNSIFEYLKSIYIPIIYFSWGCSNINSSFVKQRAVEFIYKDTETYNNLEELNEKINTLVTRK